MDLDAPFNELTLRSPRLADRAAPAACCCAFDFAGMVISFKKPPPVGITAHRQNSFNAGVRGALPSGASTPACDGPGHLPVPPNFRSLKTRPPNPI